MSHTNTAVMGRTRDTARTDTAPWAPLPHTVITEASRLAR
jgi:hypothetical protein